MKIYDITQPLFSCVVFPGDPRPEKTEVLRIQKGDICNLTAFQMCAHNGTHVDAPFHFLQDGKTIEQVALERFVGRAFVKDWTGEVRAEDAKAILEQAKTYGEEAARRILIKGKSTVTEEAAQVFADAGIFLVGNESQTVGPEDGPMKTHLILLGKEVVLLEGIRLGEVPEGRYLLNCAPINLEGCDGAPCRAILMEM